MLIFILFTNTINNFLRFKLFSMYYLFKIIFISFMLCYIKLILFFLNFRIIFFSLLARRWPTEEEWDQRAAPRL
jgi:hypothetical protein